VNVTNPDIVLTIASRDISMVSQFNWFLLPEEEFSSASQMDMKVLDDVVIVACVDEPTYPSELAKSETTKCKRVD
jgi:hypothetical protein